MKTNQQWQKAKKYLLGKKAWEGQKGWIAKGQEGTLGMTDGFISIYVCQNSTNCAYMKFTFILQ